MEKYDVIIIGTGPAGEKAAVKAAYFGHKVAVIEKEKHFGGAGVNTGTLPSKTLKESALFFSGRTEKGLYGVDKALKHQASIDDFMFRKNFIVDSESLEVRRNLENHDVVIYEGMGSLEDAHTVKIINDKGAEVLIYGENIIIATGSYPFHPENIPFDRKRVFDSDTILEINHIPQSICVIGAGVIGCEYATIFSTMGSKVYLINRDSEIMPFLDKEITRALVEQMQKDGIEIFFNNSMKEIHVPEAPEGADREQIRVGLSTGEWLHVDMFLYAAGRSGNTKGLGIEKLGIKLGKRETIATDDQYRTNIPNIYAVGDVIGFPSLASTGMDQGRVAITHMYNTGDLDHIAKILPFGVYTIPEVSKVGLSEEEAQKANLNYCVGKARHKDMARGKIMGTTEGFLKLVFTKDDLVVQGVHIIGSLATELIHYGMALISNKTTLLQIISTVFNYPTLHDLYKYAAYDGLGNLSGHKVKEW